MIAAAALISLLFAACQPAQESGVADDVRVVVISLDGMADWVLDRLLAEGRMPNLARILEMGTSAEHAWTTLPAITAVGHCSIWTGTDPSHNGITGNQMIPPPFSSHTILDGHTGFHSAPLRAEPIWSAAARQGKRVVVVQATQAAPFDAFLGEGARFPAPADKMLLFDGYIEGEIPGEVITAEVGFAPAGDWANLPEHDGQALEFSRRVGGTELWFLLYDDPGDPVEGLDSLSICPQRDGSTELAEVKPGPADVKSTELFSTPVEVDFDGKPGSAFFRLFELAPDGSAMLLYRTRVKALISSDEEAGAKMRAAAGGFTGNGASGFYEHGDFGPTIFEGGDGTAERRYLETARLCIGLSAAALKTGMEQFDWDLLIGYTAFPDEQHHSWLGYAAETIGSAESELGGEIWPYLLETYEMIDEYVGTALDSLPDNAVLFVVSDHGFGTFDKIFNPNFVLREAGLLVLDEEGEVDLDATEAIYYPGSNNSVLINTVRFKGGWLAGAESDEVIDKAMEALLAFRDEQGQQVVTRVIQPVAEAELGMNGPHAGDLYIELAPGYYPGGRVDSEAAVVERPPFGAHCGDPRSRQMNSIVVIGGKPLINPTGLGVFRSIDIAPTVCAILGIEPPANATGQAVEAVLGMLAAEQ